MKHTRKWDSLEQEAKRLAAAGAGGDEIARHLKVDRSTVTRWIKSGKLKLAGRTRPDVITSKIRATARQTPRQWANAVRREYRLDTTDDQLVTLAQTFLALANNPKIPTNQRMAASAEYRALVRQLNLVVRGTGEQEQGKPGQPSKSEPVAPKAEVPERPASRPRVDPRGFTSLKVVK